MRCPSCGRTHRLEHAEHLGATPLERSQRAEAYAKANKIDLASAYSVLLGIMPLDKAMSLGAADERAATDLALAAARDDAPLDVKVVYDPGFHPAITEGFLTIVQAMERGDRVIYASRLAQRYGLSTHEAFLVADNRITLAEARRRDASSRHRVDWPGHAFAAWAGWGMAAVSVLFFMLGAVNWLIEGKFAIEPSIAARRVQVGKIKVPTVQASAVVRTNARGEVIGIEALNPESVLDAYCKSVRGGVRPRPIRIVTRTTGDRLGVFKKGETLLAIAIRKDDRTAFWVAGNDSDPIAPVDPINGEPILVSDTTVH